MADAGTPHLSIVIPVLNDAPALSRLLAELEPRSLPGVEVVVADGGSSDAPQRVVAAHRARLVGGASGRGAQLAAGIAAARGTWLWLLHADSSAVAGPLQYLWTLSRSGAAERPRWGRFDVVFEPPSPALRIVAFMMRQRSRLTGICTGDQGLFVHRALLERAGGMPRQPLMEDIELSRRLKRLSPPLARREALTTSSRRWRQRGVVRTVLAMWRFRLRYWLGASPERLAREYYR